jgi:DNA invertase Pin-like site-specific DNA recombinase
MSGVMHEPGHSFGKALTWLQCSHATCTENPAENTTTPAGKALFQMMGVFAEFERSMIQERVRAGLARARSEGKRLGRPTIPKAKEDAIRAALSQPGRPGVRVIAKQFGVDPGTVQRISRPFGEAASAVA